jgi:hypothetical protein
MRLDYVLILDSIVSTFKRAYVIIHFKRKRIYTVTPCNNLRLIKFQSWNLKWQSSWFIVIAWMRMWSNGGNCLWSCKCHTRATCVKVNGSNLVTYLDRTPIFKYCVDRYGSRNGYWNSMCLKEIELHTLELF